MGLGIQEMVALNPSGLVDQNAQGFAGAIQTVAQQRRAKPTAKEFTEDMLH